MWGRGFNIFWMGIAEVYLIRTYEDENRYITNAQQVIWCDHAPSEGHFCAIWIFGFCGLWRQNLAFRVGYPTDMMWQNKIWINNQKHCSHQKNTSALHSRLNLGCQGVSLVWMMQIYGFFVVKTGSCALNAYCLSCSSQQITCGCHAAFCSRESCALFRVSWT